MSRINSIFTSEHYDEKLTDEDYELFELEFENLVKKIHQEATITLNVEEYYADDNFYSFSNCEINIVKVIFMVGFDENGIPVVDILDKDYVHLTTEYPKNIEEFQRILAKY